MASRAASRRFCTCDSRSKKKQIRSLEKITKEKRGWKFYWQPWCRHSKTIKKCFAVSEVTADDNLMRLCPVKVVVGFVELAELVADVVLGTRI